MQAAVDPMPVAAQLFDLAALKDGADDPTLAEALAQGSDAGEGGCGRDRIDPFQPDLIVVCGERPRTFYRVTTVSAPVEPSQFAVDCLANYTGCGTSQNPAGCFAGIAVVRAGLKGGVTLLPDRPRPSTRTDRADRDQAE